MNKGHSTTSMAVKSVVSKIKEKLSPRFSFLPVLPEFFYDFEKGLSDQFKQYYAKIPMNDRKDSWVCLAYSYDSADRSSIQPRSGFQIARPVSSTLKRNIDIIYCEVPVVFSILTNDSKTLNALVASLETKVSPSFTCKYQDLLWPTWLPEQQHPEGWYIRPSKPNGCLYMCSQTGTSGTVEPEWSDNIGDIIQDNEAQWTCIAPDLLTVRAGNFAKNSTIIQNPIDQGIMYQYDFSLTLHYVDMDDADTYVGVITEIECKLLNYYKERHFEEILRVPD